MNKWKISTIVFIIISILLIGFLALGYWATAVVWEERDYLLEENYDLTCKSFCMEWMYTVYDNRFQQDGECACTEPVEEEMADTMIINLDGQVWTSKLNQWIDP